MANKNPSQKKTPSTLGRVARRAATGAATGLVVGSQVDPSATHSWAKTLTNMGIGATSAVLGSLGEHMHSALRSDQFNK